MKHYPVELKLEAMRLCYEEGQTRAEVTARLGIRDPHAAKKWGRQYQVDYHHRNEYEVKATYASSLVFRERLL